MAVASAIRTEGLTKRFGDVLALDGLDLVVERGEALGFLGPNGAGKTTTIRLLLHLIHPNAGRAWVMDVPVDDVARAPAPRLCRRRPRRASLPSRGATCAAHDSSWG
jgi:ABC-type multidrug transport system ATPase subunit